MQFAGTPKSLLEDVSFDVRPGELVALLGRTGCGKSTLLACITGELRPNKGKILVDEFDFSSLPAHRRARRISLVSQRRGAGVPGHMRVREVVWTFANGHSSPIAFMRRSEADRTSRRLLEPLLPQLCDRLDSQVKEISAGEYQVLSLACATAILEQGAAQDGTRVLLLDEHVAHLDSKTAAFVMDLTRKTIRERNLAAVFVSHDLRLATSLSDRAVVLTDGLLVHNGPLTEVDHAANLVYEGVDAGLVGAHDRESLSPDNPGRSGSTLGP